METAQKIQRSKYALVAVAEARLKARRNYGDAAMVQPSARQCERIAQADECTREDAVIALAAFEAHPLGILLYGCEGGFDAQTLLQEMRAGVRATI